MKFGYARVSTRDQNLDSQIDLLLKEGVDKRLIYLDKYTGTTRKRPQLDLLLSLLKEEDTLVVTRLSRLARSRNDIFYLIDLFNKKKVFFKSLKENFDVSTPEGRMMYGMFAVVNECTNEISKEYIKEGFASGRARGMKYGRPFKLNNYEIIAIKEQIHKGKTIGDIANDLKISRQTIYNYLKR